MTLPTFTFLSRLVAVSAVLLAGIGCARAPAVAPAAQAEVAVARASPTPSCMLRVGTSGDYPPFSGRTDGENGELTGFSVELAEEPYAEQTPPRLRLK